MIKVNNVSKSYKMYNKPIDRMKEALSPTRKQYHHDFWALKDMNLEVRKGESLGIVGTNGSGKSTLLKMITGVLTPTSGTIEVNGKISALLELGAGFNPEYTGIENIYLNGTMMGYTKEEMDTKVQGILDFADIGEFVYQPVKTYSSGMFARLAFAVAINVEPDILIVDEALSVGDIRFQLKCVEKLKEMKNKGVTILFVTHAIEQIRRFCNRAIWIQNGTLRAEGDAGEVTDMYENFMVYGDIDSNITEEAGRKEDIEIEEDIEIIMPKDKNILAKINSIKISKEKLKTFDELYIDVEYEIYEKRIENFLLGVAILTADRTSYIFGPNTYLDKIVIPNTFGRHRVRYKISKLPLIKGKYSVDVGIFANEGLVNLDYKNDAESFQISNEYFTEGTLFIEHEWKILK